MLFKSFFFELFFSEYGLGCSLLVEFWGVGFLGKFFFLMERDRFFSYVFFYGGGC